MTFLDAMKLWLAKEVASFLWVVFVIVVCLGIAFLLEVRNRK